MNPNKRIDLKSALAVAERAARDTGLLLLRHRHGKKRANLVTQHDIKLELDVRAQKLIERTLLSAFPQTALIGEEGVMGNPNAECRWVVDPIDGTVNFAYGIPHSCVSIALQERGARATKTDYEDGYNTIVGVVYDPFCAEMWTGIRGQQARLNGKPIRVSRRHRLREAIISIGFAKYRETMDATLPYFNNLVYRIRKIRMMGSATLALTYVASGRFDAYIERGIRLWDIAAGGLILECAGGEFWHKATDNTHGYRMIASNGLLRRALRVPA